LDFTERWGVGVVNTRRRKIILTFYIFILILSFSDLQTLTSQIDIEPANTSHIYDAPVISNYTTHDGILIENDTDFETQGWPGNGSISNPYIIAGLNITADEVIIQISFTSVYFEIQDCHLSATSWNTPISLMYSGNALINNCIIEGRNGLRLFHSSNVIFQNSIMKATSYPIRAEYSSGFKMMNCTFPEVDPGAFPRNVELHYCTNAIVNGNVLHGIYFAAARSMDISFTSNNFTEGGIMLLWGSPSPYSDVSDNRVNGKPLLYLDGNESLVIEADEYGQIILDECSNILVQNGTMEDTQPIQLSNCVRCTVQNITATRGYSGIYDFDSNFTIIRNCTFNEVFAGGIWMTHCGSSLIENCTSNPHEYFFSTSRFIVQSCINTTMKQCRIFNNEDEALYFTGEDMRLSHCIIQGARYGVHVRGINMTVDSNHIYGTTSEHTTPFFSAGIYSRYLKESTISNNLIENGDDYGIFVFSNDTLFVNNIIINNEGVGIELLNSSHGNILYGNILESNLDGNALDNGFNNQWDDGVSIGNTWDDFNPLTETEYTIPGIAGSIDRFPKNSTTYTPTGSITESITDSTNATTSQTTIENEIPWITIIIASTGLVIIVIVIIIKKR